MENFEQYLDFIATDIKRITFRSGAQFSGKDPHLHNEWEIKFFQELTEIVPPGIVHSSSCGDDFLGALIIQADKLRLDGVSFFPSLTLRRKENTFPYECILQALSLMPEWAEDTAAALADSLITALKHEFVKRMNTVICEDTASRIETYLEHNYYRSDFSISNMAEYLGYSQQYLNRSCRQDSGISLVKKLINIRLAKAAELLLSGNYSVTEAAKLTGWRSPFYFSTVFKKHYGLQPREFQKRAAAEKAK